MQVDEQKGAWNSSKTCFCYNIAQEGKEITYIADITKNLLIIFVQVKHVQQLNER
jgi:hypothetical protein